MAAKTFTTVEVARRVGVSRQTLQTWIARRVIPAPKPIALGRVRVRLWTKADIERTKRFKGTLRRGPKTRRKKR